MNENLDRLMDQLMEEVARKNGPPNLRARIMAATRGEPMVQRPTHAPGPAKARLRLMPVYTTMVAAALIVGVLLNFNYIGEMVTRAVNPAGARNASDTRQSGSQPPAPTPTAEPKPAINAENNPVQPAAEQPSGPPNPSEAKPEPRKPDEIKKPEEPTREQRRPEGVVEEPRKPEPTTPPKPPTPEEPVVIANVLGKPKLKVRYADRDPWSDFDGTPLKSGVQLQARGSVDIVITAGGLLRLNGEAVVNGDAGRLEVILVRDDIYMDNCGANLPFKVIWQKLAAELGSGAALFSTAPGVLDIACFDGDVVTAAGNVEAGKMKRLTARGLGAAKPIAPGHMLNDLPARTLLREDFDQEPKGGLYGGLIEKGAVVARGHGEFVAFRYNPTLAVMPRMAVKIRLRASRFQRLQLELFEQGGNGQPWLIHLVPKQGEWVEVTVRFDDLRQRDKPQARLSPDTLLRNFKLYVEGEKDASLELDWVEFVRHGPMD